MVMTVLIKRRQGKEHQNKCKEKKTTKRLSLYAAPSSQREIMTYSMEYLKLLDLCFICCENIIMIMITGLYRNNLINILIVLW